MNDKTKTLWGTVLALGLGYLVWRWVRQLFVLVISSIFAGFLAYLAFFTEETKAERPKR